MRDRRGPPLGGIRVVSNSPRSAPEGFLYFERNLVERFFNIIKHFRAIATRYENTASNFLAGVHFVCALAWLK